jgi:cell division protein FtsB
VERGLPVAVLALAVVAVPVLMFSSSGLPRLEALQRERGEAQLEASKMVQEIRQLRAEVDRVRNQPEAVEQVARDRLGLVRQTEIVFQFDER